MDYKKTLNLPNTSFKMKANLPQKEPQMINQWDKSGLYKRILESRQGKERFTLHDGPPYANGHLHMGHALNKILKDIVVKSQTLQGKLAHFVPGWDCHGLPIEHQISKDLGEKAETMPRPSFRRACRKYAQKFIDIQRKEFKRLGVLGQWEEPYFTMSNPYESAIAREFGKIVGNGGVYRGRKPVYWCASCGTALAEAEIEYHDHTSASIYVKFEMVSDVAAKVPEAVGLKVYSVIWTTTPWTIPANLGLAFHPEFDYGLYDVGNGEAWILAEMLAPVVMETVGQESFKKLASFKGQLMERQVGRHPFIDRDSLGVVADYVTLESGTGIVHTAPGHGRDDYVTGVRYGLDAYAPVDNKGRFTEDVPEFQGQFVFDANDNVNALLKEKGALLYAGKEKHQYPHCWRCKSPIIFRSTPQWFLSMDTNDLRKKSLECIENVNWVPRWGHERIVGMMAGRPDWCLSRQRSWGIPIIAFHCTDCGEVLLEKNIIDHVADLFLEKTSDIWFEKEAAELMPAGTTCKKCGGANFEKENDILDVWFDSGVSHAAVCEPDENLGWPVDLYLEGSDQHRGWFNTSLLTAVASRGTAPFGTVLTHGFVVTGEGLKMSKSLGNAMAPTEIMEKFGAEILRLWVAAEDYRDDIRVSDEIINGLVDSYRRIRNTWRFILGNLGDFDPEKDRVPYAEMSELDRWILAKMEQLSRRLVKAYNEYEFHLVFHSLHNFCAVELSAIYLDICKDRMYASAPEDNVRRSAQTAMFDLLVKMTKLLAPICAFTAEEVWAAIPDFSGKEDSIHLSCFEPENDQAFDKALLEKWDTLLFYRREINKVIETARKEKVLGRNLDAFVELAASGGLEAGLTESKDLLKELLNVSQLEVVPALDGQGVVESEALEGLKIKVTKSTWNKCERCWGYFPEVGTLDDPNVCSRCADVLSRIDVEE